MGNCQNGNQVNKSNLKRLINRKNDFFRNNRKRWFW